ncbi:MFS transporter [Aquabacterium lacunae]|uniref:MFS transporter n=1 Tax=Aquabacterium lacunae TaxID=2528630 RepID=UPI0013EF0460|nr:MFS transporter [Aquabacterium lacunae]
MALSVERTRADLAPFLIGFLSFSLLYGVQPLLPVFAQAFAIGPADSALALSSSTATLAVSIVLTAWKAQGIDRRSLMLGALALSMACQLASAWSPHWWTLVLCRAVLGLCLGAVPATAMAYVADTTPPARLATGMGLYVAGTALGGMSGRVGVSALSDWLGWREALTLHAAGALVVWAVVAWAMPQRPTVAQARKASAKPWPWLRTHPTLWRLFLCGGLASGLFVATYNYAGFRLLGEPFGLSTTQVGLIFLCYLCGVASSSLSGRWVRRWGWARVQWAACGLTGLGLVISPLPHLGSFVLALCLMTWGFFTLHALCSGRVGQDSGPHRSQATALYLLSYYVGSSVFGYAAGWLWDHGGWLGLCAGLAAMLLAFMGLLRSVNRALAQASGQPSAAPCGVSTSAQP